MKCLSSLLLKLLCCLGSQTWYEAEITAVETNGYAVTYTQYGNSEVVKITDIKLKDTGAAAGGSSSSRLRSRSRSRERGGERRDREREREHDRGRSPDRGERDSRRERDKGRDRD
eukprot:SAG11_NODE_3099_length_2694_cov_1.515607_1_plen_114_part_10